jgi:hypothetical protein
MLVLAEPTQKRAASSSGPEAPLVVLVAGIYCSEHACANTEHVTDRQKYQVIMLTRHDIPVSNANSAVQVHTWWIRFSRACSDSRFFLSVKISPTQRSAESNPQTSLSARSSRRWISRFLSSSSTAWHWWKFVGK